MADSPRALAAAMSAAARRAAVAACAALAVFHSAPVAAQEAGDDGQFDDQDIEEDFLKPEQLRSLHAKFDENRDGKVSLQEVTRFAMAMGREIAAKDSEPILQEIDTNKDNKLSLEEHLADIHNQADGGDEEELKELEARKALEAAKHKAADRNGDGVLDGDELPALFYPETMNEVLIVTVQATMRQKDLDGDGKLTPVEFWEAHEPEGDELSEEEKADFVKLDANQDGFLQIEELQDWESGMFHTAEAMKKMIEIADKDGDMHITADELANAAEEIAISDSQYHLIEWVEHNEL